MSTRKKKPSAADVLRQEMQQPLVLPDRQASPPEKNDSTSAAGEKASASAAAAVDNGGKSSPPDDRPLTNSTPTKLTNMTQSNSNDAAANEAKLKQQIEDLQSKLKAQTGESQKLQTKTENLSKELKEAKDTVVKLAAQGKAPAKSSTAIAKVDPNAGRSALTARPVETSAETAIRRANTDIGWLD
jgi:phage shock protein A